MAREVTQSEWGRIIAHAWIDTTFAHELSTDPAKAARSFLKLDPNAEVHVFDIPAKPADLSHGQIEDIRSGKAVGLMVKPYCC